MSVRRKRSNNNNVGHGLTRDRRVAYTLLLTITATCSREINTKYHCIINDNTVKPILTNSFTKRILPNSKRFVEIGNVKRTLYLHLNEFFRLVDTAH